MADNDLAALIAAGPGGSPSASDNEPNPVGVPKGYQFIPPPSYGIQSVQEGMPGRGMHGPTQTPIYGVSQGAPVAPKYFQGYEFTPTGWGPEKIAQLQGQLMEAGLIHKAFRLGVWDPVSRSAFVELLTEANAAGTTWEQAVSARAQGIALDKNGRPTGTGSGGGRGGGGVGRAPLQVRLTDDSDLAKIANAVASSSVLGRALSEQETQKFIEAFHGMQRDEQQAAYAGVGTVESAPSPQAAAEDFARNSHPVEAGAHDIAGTFDNFLKIIGGNPHG